MDWEQQLTLSVSPVILATDHDVPADTLLHDTPNITDRAEPQDFNPTWTLANADSRAVAPCLSAPTTKPTLQFAPISDDVLIALTEPFLMSWCMQPGSDDISFLGSSLGDLPDSVDPRTSLYASQYTPATDSFLYPSQISHGPALMTNDTYKAATLDPTFWS
jgi:hypothetical protein